MNKLRLFLTTFILTIIISGCASEYARLNSRIIGVFTPRDLALIAVDIQTAEITPAQKNELNVKLAKRTLKIAEIYIKTVVDGKKTPEKDDVLAIIKSLSASLDNIDRNELAAKISNIIKSLSFMLLR